MKNKDTEKKNTPQSNHDIPIVGVGASAGGLAALEELFKDLTTDIQMAFVVVQHSDPAHVSLLPEILSKKTKLKVVSAEEGDTPKPGVLYITPSNVFLAFSEGKFSLTAKTKTRDANLPIDRFLRSLAEQFEKYSIAVILSGGGTDGALGVQEVKARGGITFAQDEASAGFSSMPHNAFFTGSVDFVLSPSGIAASLKKIADHAYLSLNEDSRVSTLLQEKSDDFKAILSLVYRISGIDFRQYKNPTISRRLLRRMNLNNSETLGDYLQLLKTDPKEINALCQDLLIQVTKFFRDPEVFQVLKEKVFPTFVKNRPQGESLRVWVPGCSSGEEVYSILIAFTEFLEASSLRYTIQMFGSDVSEVAINRARAGVYIENILMDVSEERLRRFFTKVGKTYEINKALRDQCIFAKHNLASDPPFGKLDLITCRNVLIYLESPLQKKVLSVFHYALKSHGILLLGNAETAEPELYTPLDPKYKVYEKRQVPTRLYFDYAAAQQAAERVSMLPENTESIEGISKGLQIQREVDRYLLGEFVPAGVLVASNLEVIQFRGRTGPYFEHSPGFANLDLLKMLREGLVTDVRAALEAAKKSGQKERREDIQLRQNGTTKKIAIEVIPFLKTVSRDEFFLLIFEEMDIPQYEKTHRIRAHKEADRSPKEDTAELSSLRAELLSTKEYLQSVNEEKEAANEELKAANEEIMSSNEELQSMNEELHTSKEELQSSNEELITLNDELRMRNNDLSQLSDDLSNLFNSLNNAILLLTKDLRVRKFTPMAEKLFRLIPSDLGRSVFDIRPNIEIKNFEELLREVQEQMAPKEFEIEDNHGNWYSVNIRPYRTSDDRMDGLVLLFTDITHLKTSLIYAEAVETTMSHPLLVMNGDLIVKRANRSYYETFKTSQEHTVNRTLSALGNGQWDIPELKKLLTNILPTKTELRDFKVTKDFPLIGKKTVFLNAQRLFYNNQSTETILMAIRIEA